MDLRSFRAPLALLLVGLVIAIVAIALAEPSEDEGKPRLIATAVDGPDRDRVKDDKVVAPAESVAAAERRFEAADHDSLRSERPQVADLGGLLDERDELNREAQGRAPALPTAGATQSVPGCVTRFIGAYSGRNGVLPRLLVEHYTVSYNVPGWSDVWSIVSYFARTRTASSHFVIDAEGHCAYIVPIEHKAWTQAAANPSSISTEHIAYGNEKQLATTAGYNKTAQVNRWVGKRVGIPMRRGKAVSCGAERSGIVQHKDFGACGGGHHDITPFSIDYIVRISAKGVKPGCASKRTAQIAAKLDYHRKRRGHFAEGSKGWRDHNQHIADWERTARGRYRGLGVADARAHRRQAKHNHAGLRCRRAVLRRRISP
jgi:hypothetical protein